MYIYISLNKSYYLHCKNIINILIIKKEHILSLAAIKSFLMSSHQFIYCFRNNFKKCIKYYACVCRISIDGYKIKRIL